MIAAGLMSGTSADGIDAAAVALDGGRPRFVAHVGRPYPPLIKNRALAAASGAPMGAADLARLHAAIGDEYAEAALALAERLGRSLDCVAVHGQTVAHHPAEGVTFQLGDASRVAIATGAPVICDFRSADVALGGQGAPLVPFADHLLFAEGAPRAILNLGGIANLTLLPTDQADDVIAFDTGPANMVIDQLARKRGEELDRDGAAAARGHVVETALRRALDHPFFSRAAPKSTGREDFGATFTQGLLRDVHDAGGSLDDAIATATELTAESVAQGLRAAPVKATRWRELLVAGGGAANPTLLARIGARTGLEPRPTDELGVPARAREAMAFAILGAYRMRGQPNTLPRCTGASRAVSAGAIHRP